MIRILIVDDSPSIVLLLRTLFETQPDMEVVGEAGDGAEAIRMCAALRPSVITMDIRMPHMDGIEATRMIMRETPTPIVVVSAALEEPQVPARLPPQAHELIGFQALEVGALAVVQKPPGPGNPRFKALVRDLIDTVRAMAAIKVFKHRHAAAHLASQAAQPPPLRRAVEPPAPLWRETRPMPPPSDPNPGGAEGFGISGFADTDFASALPMLGFAPIPDRLELLAIAASTGGPQSLVEVLAPLPEDFPVPIVVVQHIAQGFIGGMAEWLDGRIKLKCGVAEDAQTLLPGHVYLAPDKHHLLIARSGTKLRAHLFFGAPVSRHLPSATPFFQSIAKSCGPHALGLVLTGMGPDGAEGLLALRRAGGVTLVQSPATCVAPSMPMTAMEMGAVDEVVALNRIGSRLMAMANYQRRPPAAVPQ